MTKPRTFTEELAAERLPKWRQTANPNRPEAIAMRRIVAETGRWLSPFMRDTPLPVLTEFERTADLIDLLQTRYVPVDDSLDRPEPTPARKTGANRRAKKVLTLAEIREKQNANTSKATERRRKSQRNERSSR